MLSVFGCICVGGRTCAFGVVWVVVWGGWGVGGLFWWGTRDIDRQSPLCLGSTHPSRPGGSIARGNTQSDRGPTRPAPAPTLIMAPSEVDCRAIFRQFDTDGSGTVNKAELAAMCSALHFNVTEAEVAAMMQEADTTGTMVSYVSCRPSPVPHNTSPLTPSSLTPSSGAAASRLNAFTPSSKSTRLAAAA
jgi:hypothetical protein